jgi:hypothetical protein
MDPDSFRAAVEEAKETELGRLGSGKLLIALTDADLERPTVLRAAADSENAARTTFRTWADEEADADAGDLFAAVADEEDAHFERVVDAMDDATADAYDPADGGPLHAYLRGRESTLERVAGGLVGRGLVADRTHLQVISFFVNEGDEKTADLFRDLRGETQARIDEGLTYLGEHCEADEDWDRARAVAEYVIQIAYDDFADTLGGMGLDPKPIC